MEFILFGMDLSFKFKNFKQFKNNVFLAELDVGSLLVEVVGVWILSVIVVDTVLLHYRCLYLDEVTDV